MKDTGVTRSIAFARFPGLICDATKDFQRLTGVTAVTTFSAASSESWQTRRLPLPPVHPLCAKVLRETCNRSICKAEWKEHLQFAGATKRCRIHTCPFGHRCAALPIAIDDALLGIAKLVSGPDIPLVRFRSLVGQLEVLLARPCQDLRIIILQEENRALRSSLNRLRQVKQPTWPTRGNVGPHAIIDQANVQPPHAQTLISQVLLYLNQHYADKELSLTQVARSIRRNEKYLSHLFSRHVGQKMRTYITTLRLRHACELLLQGTQTIEHIASDSGFARTVHFRQSFRRAMGVTASEYREIFTAST